MDDELELAIEQHFGAMGLDDHMFGTRVETTPDVDSETVFAHNHDGKEEVKMGSGIIVSPDMDPKEALAHYGKKGMKWGVRNDKGHEGEAVKTKKLDKLDEKWEKDLNSPKTYIKVYNATADRMNNGEIDKFNEEPRWKKAADDGLLMDDDHPETKAYFDAYETLSNKIFAEETVKLGMNPSGTKQFEITNDEDGQPYAYLTPVKKTEVKHAEGDTTEVLKINRDDNGLVIDMTSVTLELKHYGVKGMHWGVSRASKGGGPSRSELRTMNKAAKREENLKLTPQKQKPTTNIDREILKARSELSRASQQYRDAKSVYKVEKKEIGRVAAKQSLNKAGDKLSLTRDTADMLTTKEKSAYNSMLIGEGIAALLTGKPMASTQPGSLDDIIRRMSAKAEVENRS